MITTSQGTCTLAPLTATGRLFTCNLGALANNASATVRVTVTRAADAFVNDRSLNVQTFVQDPAGFFPLHPNDPDGTNNSLQQSITFNR